MELRGERGKGNAPGREEEGEGKGASLFPKGLSRAGILWGGLRGRSQ